MALQDIIELNRLRCEIATTRAMQTWQSGPTTYGNTCPHCTSTNYVKYSIENGTQRYRCNDCRRRFNERPFFRCSCEQPGQISRCHGCPKFETFLSTFKSYTEKLRLLNRAELEAVSSQIPDSPSKLGESEARKADN